MYSLPKLSSDNVLYILSYMLATIEGLVVYNKTRHFLYKVLEFLMTLCEMTSRLYGSSVNPALRFSLISSVGIDGTLFLNESA